MNTIFKKNYKKVKELLVNIFGPSELIYESNNRFYVYMTNEHPESKNYFPLPCMAVITNDKLLELYRLMSVEELNKLQLSVIEWILKMAYLESFAFQSNEFVNNSYNRYRIDN